MTATFLLPFAMGACEALGGNIITDAFGVVAMVAMTPLITIQLLGVAYQRKLKKTAVVEEALPVEDDDDEIDTTIPDGEMFDDDFEDDFQDEDNE